MSLNDSKIRNLKPSAKPFKVSDSHGLYLLIKPGGSRHWYLKYRISGKESRIALGAYPAVSLSDARQQREGIRKMLALNINRQSSGPLNALQAHRKKCLKPWRCHGIKVTGNGHRTLLTVCLPA